MVMMQSDDMCASPATDFDFAPLNLHTFIMTDLVSGRLLLRAHNKQQHNLRQLIGLQSAVMCNLLCICRNLASGMSTGCVTHQTHCPSGLVLGLALTTKSALWCMVTWESQTMQGQKLQGIYSACCVSVL